MLWQEIGSSTATLFKRCEKACGLLLWWDGSSLVSKRIDRMMNSELDGNLGWAIQIWFQNLPHMTNAAHVYHFLRKPIGVSYGPLFRVIFPLKNIWWPIKLPTVPMRGSLSIFYLHSCSNTCAFPWESKFVLIPNMLVCLMEVEMCCFVAI